MKILAVFIFVSTASILSEAKYGREIKTQKDGMHVELNKISPYELEPPEGECPDPVDILPCTCDSYLQMHCNNVTSEEQLRSIFSKPFPQDNLVNFVIDQYQFESNITYLDRGIFGTKTFQGVYFQFIKFNLNLDIFDLMNSTLHTIYFNWAYSVDSFVKDFSSFTNLTVINLIYTSIEEYFVRSPSVVYLSITDSHISEGSRNQSLYLGPMPNLDRLWLQMGNLHIMPDISQYPKIYEYYVVNNYISYIKSEMVPNYLDEFHAFRNNIQDIEVGSVKVNYGAEVDFYSNLLSHLDEEKWKNIFINASSVYLQYNPWLCGCEMAWIFGSDPEYTPFLSKLDGAETCANGTLFTDLDPKYYDTYC